LEQNPNKINWERLSGNPNAIHLLEQNPNKINWERLSGNPNAIHLLEKNQDKINWKMLSENPNAIHLLEQNTKINYELFKNPNIFTINYDFLRKRLIDTGILEGIAMNRFHPTNLNKFVGWGYNEFECI
jgi:hypothetical protein